MNIDKNNEKEQSNIPNSTTAYSKTTRTKSSRKHGRFNIVDFCLILVVLAVVATLVMYFIPDASKRLVATNETEITYILEFKEVDSAYLANIQNGNAVYDAETNYMIGNVKSVENYASVELVYNDKTGFAEMREHPTLKNVIVTVTVKAIYTEGEGYSVNGERIAVGSLYNVRFPKYSGEAYCIEMSANSN